MIWYDLECAFSKIYFSLRFKKKEKPLFLWNGYTVLDIKAIEWRHSEAYENSSFIFTAGFQSIYFQFTLQQGTKYTWCLLHVPHSQMEKKGNKNETM